MGLVGRVVICSTIYGLEDNQKSPRGKAFERMLLRL